MTFEEKTLNSEYIYKGKVLNLRLDEVTTVNGTSMREIVEHNGGASLIAITDEGKLVMVEQYRKAIGQTILEVPAGKREIGEDAFETACRELKEETGYTAGKVELIGEIYSSPGYTSEKIFVYLCMELIPGNTDFDDNEALNIVEYPFEDVVTMAVSGKLCDGKTVASVLLAKEILQRRRLL